jgi:hypothetical protein
MYGQTELVGYPLFDSVVKTYLKNVKKERSNKLLIMSANTPYFSDYERSLVEQSLVDLNERLKHQDYWKPVWRVRKLDLKSLGIDIETQEENTLHQTLSEVGAVISTPSTVIMLTQCY